MPDLPGYEQPLYTVFQYGNTGVFKVVKFKRSSDISIRLDDQEDEQERPENDSKLDNNICRAKSNVLQLALCNRWQYFATFTLDKEKYDRYDLKAFQRDLSQWIRDMRKKYQADIKFMYVPEQHEDGAWHAHGLLANIPDCMTASFKRGVHPEKLIKRKYRNIPEYEKKFGFISIGRIKNPVATAFYITKYITKSIGVASMDLGQHLYYASKGLQKAVAAYDVYYPVEELDKALQYKGEFCSFGIVQKKKWHYGYEDAEFRDMDDLEQNNWDDEPLEKGNVDFEELTGEQITIIDYEELLKVIAQNGVKQE